MTADRIKALEDALRPFALVAGEMFARNWNRGDVALLFKNQVEEIRLTFEDFLAANAALAASRAAPDCQQPDLVTAADFVRHATICRSCNTVFDAKTNPHSDDDCTAHHADWDAPSLSEVADAMQSRHALDLTPAPAVEQVAPTAQDAARVPEIAALIEAANGLGLRALVAGWNGEGLDRPYTPHKSHLSATIKTTCGTVYAIDAALRAIAGGDA